MYEMLKILVQLWRRYAFVNRKKESSIYVFLIIVYKTSINDIQILCSQIRLHVNVSRGLEMSVFRNSSTFQIRDSCKTNCGSLASTAPLRRHYAKARSRMFSRTPVSSWDQPLDIIYLANFTYICTVNPLNILLYFCNLTVNLSRERQYLMNVNVNLLAVRKFHNWCECRVEFVSL